MRLVKLTILVIIAVDLLLSELIPTFFTNRSINWNAVVDRDNGDSFTASGMATWSG